MFAKPDERVLIAFRKDTDSAVVDRAFNAIVAYTGVESDAWPSDAAWEQMDGSSRGFRQWIEDCAQEFDALIIYADTGYPSQGKGNADLAREFLRRGLPVFAAQVHDDDTASFVTVVRLADQDTPRERAYFEYATVIQGVEFGAEVDNA